MSRLQTRIQNSINKEGELMFLLQDHVQQNDKVYVKTNSNIINGIVSTITQKGVWIDGNSFWLKEEDRLLEFVPYEQISDWAIE